MQAPFPSPVSTWHNDTYHAISPKRAELASAGNTAIITGAGGGIGRETAVAFAVAGARRLVLIGRTHATLIHTKEIAEASNSNTICLTFSVDVTDENAMRQVAAEIGVWDVFILNAGYLPSPSSIASADVADYWKSYETNVKPVVTAATVFLPSANKVHATMLGVTAGALCFPPASTPGLSAYLTSKMAMSKILEFLAVENPSLFVASVHPGMVDTEIFQKSGAKPEMLPMDSLFTHCETGGSGVSQSDRLLYFIMLTWSVICASTIGRALYAMALELGSFLSTREAGMGQLGRGRVESHWVRDGGQFQNDTWY